MKIVIIDDNQTNVLLLQHLVARLDGCEPIPFTDPVEAFQWCGDNDPDMIIIDYMMPEMDGLDFIGKYRGGGANSDIPIVMVTTADLKEVRYEALKRGATDFLTKPVDTTEFTARVTNLLSLRRSKKMVEDRAALLAGEVKKATSEIIERENEVIMRLSKAAEFRDPETGEHIIRMANYSRLIAEALGLPEEECDVIYRASPMHDVGKVGIGDQILLKPGRLTAEEFDSMKAHTSIGYAILQDSPSKLMQIAAEIAHSHHERWDGQGYPKGLAGEEISLIGRIVAVADVFDALCSARPYKEPWPIEKAKAYIVENSGTHFDPKCVDAFLNVFDKVIEIADQYKD